MASPLLSRCTCLILRPSTTIRLSSSAAARSVPANTNNPDRSSATTNGPSAPRETPQRRNGPGGDGRAPHRYDQENPRRTPARSAQFAQSTFYPSSSPNGPSRTAQRSRDNFEALPNEARRREEVYKANTTRELGGKAYAMQRERGRGDNAFQKRDEGVRRERGGQMRFGEGTTSYPVGNNRPSPTPRRADQSTTYEPARRTNDSYTPRVDSPAKFGAPRFADSPSTARSPPKDRHAVAQQQKNQDRQRRDQTFAPKLIPGQFNKSLSVPGVAKKAVQPVVRGGRTNDEGRGRGTGGKRKRAEMQKVVLPDTIRLENLTNILGVPLCAFLHY